MRSERIKTLEPQARAGRVFISTGCGKAGELKRQLVHFGLMRENGIVDAMQRVSAKVPVSLMRQEIEDEEAERLLSRQEEAYYHFVFGPHSEGLAELESRKRKQQEAHLAAMERAQNHNMTDILGGLDG